jgi:REP element-mobilizing transposase RayT
LEDSLPQSIYRAWLEEVEALPERERASEIARRTEKYLDGCHGSCVLKNPVAALIVQDALLYAHHNKCEMHGWTVMPNHVHALFTPRPDVTLGRVVGPLKSYTAMEINRRLGLGGGRFWQPDYYDRAIRDAEHFERVLHYIEWNAVKAGLCDDPKDWPYSTASPNTIKLLDCQLE